MRVSWSRGRCLYGGSVSSVGEPTPSQALSHIPAAASDPTGPLSSQLQCSAPRPGTPEHARPLAVRDGPAYAVSEGVSISLTSLVVSSGQGVQ